MNARQQRLTSQGLCGVCGKRPLKTALRCQECHQKRLDAERAKRNPAERLDVPTKSIPLSEITIDPRLQMRDQMNQDAIDEYAENIDQLPPASAVLDSDGHLLLTNGFHTYYAHEKAGRPEMTCNVREGSFRDAILEAAGANHDHGIRRTPADKRRAVAALLGDEEWVKASDHWIAETCHVSDQLVANVRKEATSGQTPVSNERLSPSRSRTSNKKRGEKSGEGGSKRTGKDGKTYSPKKSPVLCDRCTRVGKAVPGCNRCKDAQDADRKEKRRQKTEAKKAASNLTDPYGVPVPNGCKDAWADPWIEQTIGLLSELAFRFREPRLGDALLQRKKFYPSINVKDFIDGLGMIDNTFDLLTEHLQEKRPHAVCPACKGEKCGSCRMTGLVTKQDYESQKARLNGAPV